MPSKTTVDTDGARRVYQRVGARPLHESVVRQIAREVVSGRIEPDSALPVESVLAEQFGVSRTVIREAVRILVTKGLISVRQGSGMRVRSPAEWDYLDPLVLFEQVRSGRGEELLEEILETRRILEVEVAGLAAARRTAPDLDGLRSILSKMGQVLEEPQEFTRLDSQFHDVILRAARNRPLGEALRPVNEVLKEGRSITNRLSTNPGASQAGHERIFAEIQRGNVLAAREAMHRHVRQFERDIHAALVSMSGLDGDE